MNSLIVITETYNIKEGTIIKNYKTLENGIVTENGSFLAKDNYIVLNEDLSSKDEKKIRDMVRQQIRLLFWNLYTKNSIIVGNL